MKYELRILLEGESDLAEAYNWYEDGSAALGSEFLRAVDTSVLSIQRNHLAFPTGHGDIRGALLRRLPFGVFYAVEENTAVVLACFHVRRDPPKATEPWLNLDAVHGGLAAISSPLLVGGHP
jgi:plasmid stabilization system protein ParE